MPTTPAPSASGAGGSLTIQVGNHINSQTLLPPISMTPVSYTISGSGPGGATFSQTTTGGSVTVNSLAFGSWSITVNAMNADGTLIGSGQAAASVHTGQTTTVAISVVPLTGNGTLNLTVSWTASQVEIPSIRASLTPPSGSATYLSFSINGSQATYSSTTIPAGYQTLTVQLLDNNVPVMGAVEVVRIVEGQTTSGTYAFTNVNQPGGSVQVNITPAMADPIPVSISGVPATITPGTSVTATASVSDGTTGVVYVWYLNGVSVGTGASFTFGNTLAAGYYRLDVTAYTATRAGSATASFQVTGAGGSQFAWTPVPALGTSTWKSFALNRDGTIMSAADMGTDGYGNIHGSSDHGATWAITAPSKRWNFLLFNDEGSRQIALVDYYDYIYVSTDFGHSWDHYSANQWFTAVGTSSNGQHIYTSAGNWYPYVSNDGGATWTWIGSQRTWWYRVIVSQDGSEAIVADSYSGGGNIFRSTDFGLTWVPVESATSKSWTGMTASDDLSRMFAVAYGDGIYKSVDHGITWTRVSTAPSDSSIRQITGSADCQRLVAASFGGNVYSSSDFGATWTRDMQAPVISIPALAMSKDGQSIIIGGFNTGVYIGRLQ
jgi:hypothetical protein